MNFSKEIKDLHDEVNSSDNLLKTKYKEKVNDFNDLHGGVTVYAKSLILLYNMNYTVYTMTYSVYFNHHQDPREDEVHGVSL